MESDFQDQGQLDQDLKERLSPRGIQSVHSSFSEENKQESIRIEDSAPEEAIISNQAPEGEISTMMVIKWSDAIKGPRVQVDGPLCGGIYKEDSWIYNSLVRNIPRCQDEFLHLIHRRK